MQTSPDTPVGNTPVGNTPVGNTSTNQLPTRPTITLKIIKPEDIVNNSWQVIDIARKHPPATWEEVFRGADDEIKDISDILENDKKVNGRFYPDCKDLFKAFELTPLNGVKVVILGQDPYHSTNHDGTPQAQGMSFSVKRGTKIPSSLVNIYKELKNTVSGFVTPNHGDLTGWSRQGVLLLNSCLTVRPNNPGSYKEIWLGFVKKVINAILDNNPGCIFVLWGRKAQKIRKMLGERAVVLESSHPSGLSCNRGFMGSNPFNQINDILKERGKGPINWNVDSIIN